MTGILGDLVVFVILVVVSLVPALVYLTWVRRTERYHEEAWGTLLRAFVYGAFLGTFISALLELILFDVFNQVLQPDIGILPKSQTFAYLILALVIAPFVEEGLKGLGVYSMRGRLRFVADGLVFGAAVGFGFGFFENFLYGVSALLATGFVGALAVLLVRSISTVILHGSATAMTGYGVAVNELEGGQGHALGGYYLLAVTMHATFNLIVSLALVLPLLHIPVPFPAYLSLLGLGAAIAFALGAFSYVRRRITELQFQAVHGPYRPSRIVYRPVSGGNTPAPNRR